MSIQVEKPAPDNPFDAPVRPADSLLRFDPDNPGGHRIHVRGVVTHAQSGSMVWIRDQASGLRIQARQEDDLEPGDEIDVLGFPTYNSIPPMLEDAVFRKTGTARPPTPLFLTNAASAFDCEDDLIATEARLTDVQPVLEGTALTLNTGSMIFKALLKSSPHYESNPGWQPGSRVRIAGICSVVHDDVRPMMGIWQPQSFQILMRSPDDLTVISRPSWWTPGHVILVLGIVIGGLLLVTSVLALLARRRLNEQGRQRAMAEAEFAAILSERNRMAREIHDTLAQGLVATSVQLRLAKKQAGSASEPLHHHLDSAQQLVRGSLEEARNSIWNMRSQVLETGDLVGALKNILTQMADGMEIETSFEITGRPRRLAPVIESNLLRVGQEAITNATKHAQARHIHVKLDFGEKQFRLVVTDDGRGFAPASPSPSDDGFGLMGMRERGAELKGALSIRSAPGQGTEISLSLPLSGE
jgi:signal transduction histidine kinase